MIILGASRAPWTPQPLLFVLPFLLVSAVLVHCQRWLLRLEGSRRPGLSDHARHCGLLYAGTTFVAVFLLAYPGLQPGNLQYDAGFAVCAVAVYGILVDALAMLLMRRSIRTQLGGAT